MKEWEKEGGGREEGREVFYFNDVNYVVYIAARRIKYSKRYWLNDTRPTKEKEEFDERHVQVSVCPPQIA